MSTGSSRASMFRGLLASDVASRFSEEDVNLEGALAEILLAVRALHPAVALDERAFLAYLAAKLPEEAASIEAARDLRVGDLYLACACAHGNLAALTVFDTAYVGPLGAVLRVPAGTDVSEVLQDVREKLLLGRDGAPPKILDYSGRGDLKSWVRVVATRIALNLARGKTREVPLGEEEHLANLAGGSDDAELGLLKKLYQHEFKDAFHQAMTALPVRDRNILRQHYIDGLTLEQIGSLYRVHRVTMTRRMGDIRKELAAETRRHLKAKLRVSPGELDSIMRLIQSRLDASLREYLSGRDGTSHG